ncbi:hypothetical protein TNCT_464011 [Trichonephila clavata]|uniref:C2H2-type domain-containing protein n=1 Tax=Trichonephila clavata TaxID=2740835 RepID=A0A8X6JG07_TRICU|nr:hypothetical protein TNCT_631471 [Trichonephila clavata]GFR05046.1 hypothetical protein TNCT_464011 [Trichonephila clavata]
MAEGNINPVKEEFSYVCPPCKRGFNSTEISFFPVSSGKSKLICIKCGNTFTSGFKTVFAEAFFPYCCDYCDRRFRTSTEVLAHSFEHSGEWPFRCFSCQRGFATDSSLEIHLITENVQCIKCREIFWGSFCSDCPPELLREIDELMCKKCSPGSRNIEYLT